MKKVINGNPMSKKLHRLSNSYLATILVVALLFGCEPRLHRAVKSRDYDQVAQYLNAGDNIDINSTTEISDFFTEVYVCDILRFIGQYFVKI
jgi:hypothetical protein